MKSMYLLRLAMACALMALVMLIAPAAGTSTVSAMPAMDLLSNCTGQYYNGTGLNEPAVFSRTDPAVNFYWPEGTSPGNGMPTNYYSVRWTCVFNVASPATYTFNMVSDDGMNVIVDGTLLMWVWYDQGPTRNSNSVYLNAGTHVIKVEYYNATNGGTAQVSWSGSGVPVYYPPASSNVYFPPVVIGTYNPPTAGYSPYYPQTGGNYYNPQGGNVYPSNPGYNAGLITNCNGEYYNNTTLSGSPVLVRVDPGVNFYWPANASPGAGVNASYYSVRWTCTVNVPATATYTFNIVTNDGMNLVVDNNVLIWAWRDQSATQYSKAIALNAGAHTIRVDYYNAAYEGVAQVSMR